MRKIVCSKCALDWNVQHCCKNWSSMDNIPTPTVIYEPNTPWSDVSPLERERDKLRKECDEARAEVVEIKEVLSASRSACARSADQLCAATKEIERLREALEFYAEPENWQTRTRRLPCECCSEIGDPLTQEDGGEKARTALEDEK